jgi:uncharacterized membrane protein (UPF0182 family)
MFREWRALFKQQSRWNVTGSGPGRGGGDKDDDNPGGQSDDPFDNFDFTRFRGRGSGDKERGSSNPPSGKEGGAKDKDNDKDSSPSSGSRPTFDFNDLFGPGGIAGGGGGRGSGGGGRGNGGGRSGQPVAQLRLPRPSRGSIVAIVIGVLVVLFFVAGPALAGLWTDAIWFDEVGQSGVFWTRIWTKVLIFIAAALITFALIMLNVAVARRIGPKGPVFSSADNPLAALIGGSVRFLNWVFILGAAFISLVLAGSASGSWQTVLQYLNAASWTETEKIFNQTVGFYVFELPFYSFIQGWLVGLFIVCLVAAGVVYGINSALNGQRFTFTPGIKTHITVLGAIILALFAWGYQLSNSKLAYSARGVVPGASATDVEAQVPANNILTVLVGLAALALLANIFIRNQRTGIGLLIGAVVLWLVGSIVVGGIYPGLVQSVSVKPNEITKETPYIENTIAQTRKAFGLDQIQVQQFGGTAQLTSQDITNNPIVERNVRLWDYNKIQTVYDQRETLRRYYDFKDVDIDRYNLDLGNTGQSQKTQVMLSARELKIENLTTQAQTWQSRHLQYTHGYGLQASPVNQVDAQGQPINLITQNFPISSTGVLQVNQPRIYYGTGFSGEDDYALVGTKLEEVDYPFTTGNEEGRSATNRYDGKGGIKLDNFFVKLAFSMRLGDFNLLISDALNDNSKLLWKRNIADRAKQIAPFLALDGDPYLVVADGKLYFIQDAYTYTTLYPHSAPLNGRVGRDPDLPSNLNYLRNSVKIITDAYDGTINFYIVNTGGADPIVQTYAKIYPSLFKPGDQIPASLKPHLRYPEDLFRTQSVVYQTYHVTDPTTYYNRQDQWQLPPDPRTEQNGNTFEPFYLVTELPGENTAEFVLIQPFVPQGKNNLVSWIAARSDGDNYGKLVAYNFQSSVNVYGPGQFYSAVNQDQEFSRSRTLLNSNGSSLQPGPLLILPVDRSVLYVLPYYLIGTGNPIPSLQFVAVSANNRVIVRPSLQEALNQVLTSGTAVNPNQPTTGPTTTPGSGTTPVAGAPSPTIGNANVTPGAATPTPGSVADLRRSLSGHLERARTAAAAGDKATADRELQLAQQDLDQLNRLLGQ